MSPLPQPLGISIAVKYHQLCVNPYVLVPCLDLCFIGLVSDNNILL